MKAIIIGAGRGRRLMPLTEDVPKCYAPIAGRRILDWTLDALRSSGLGDIVFVGGYRIERVQADYPGLRFCHNAGWERNNILASLFHAEHEMAAGFVSTYADILYTPEAAQRLVACPADIALLVDTDWRERYRPRTEHPETDGEKVRLEGGRVTAVSRDIPPGEAPAEFTGVAKFSPRGAAILSEHYRRARVDGRPFARGRTLAQAYLIDLLQPMLEDGVEMAAVETRRLLRDRHQSGLRAGQSRLGPACQPMTLPLFPASVVGSMPRPAFVRDLLELPEDDPARQRAMDAAVAYVIALQEAAGIDVVSDGEWRRRSYIGVIAEIMHGFARETREGLSWHTVVEPMRPRRPGLLGEEARFLVRHTARGTKVALPSPYLLAQRMWDPERSRDAYPTREAFMRALVPVLRGELLAVRDAGVTVAQLDDPHLCLLVDPRVRAQFADPDAEAQLCVDLLNEIVDGVDGIITAVHLCRRNKARRGWVGEGGYDPILPALRTLRVRQYVLEFTIAVAGDLAILRRLPDDCLIGLGCVDCRGERVDPVEVVVERVGQALRHVDRERLWLNPDCGFAPGSAADIPIDEAYAKLKVEAAAAEQLRQRHPR